MENVELSVPLPSSQELSSQAGQFLALANDTIVTDPESYKSCAIARQTIKGRIKSLTEMRKEATTPIDVAKKKIMDWFRVPVETYESADAILNKKLLAYDAEQERVRRAEEDRLRELARKEQERLRAKALEEERKAAAKAAELRRQAEEAAAAGRAAEAAKIAEKAAMVEEKAADKAADLQEQAQSMPTPIVNVERVAVAGMARVTIWKARVVNAALVPREYMIVNEPALNKVAAATKGSIQIAGVEFYPEHSTRSVAR